MGRSRPRSKEQLDGILVLDKPAGPTSSGCLTSIKRGLLQGKIGHGGTLDPMATGVLVVLLGHATKLAPFLSEGSKTYVGEMQLGITTDTYDIEGQVVAKKPFDHLAPEDVEKQILSWSELSEQEVPPVSAAKHKGKPLYALARAGEEVPVKVKAVEIFSVEILESDFPRFRFRVEVSPGTYIRSLVHSLGIRLECGAVLTSLRREQCHPFGLDQSFALDALLDEPQRFAERVIPIQDALPHWPRVNLTQKQTALAKNGGWIPVAEADATGGSGKPGERAMLLADDGCAVALAEVKERDGNALWSILRGLW